MKRALRKARALLAGVIAWPVAVFPSLEPALVRLGRAASRRSRVAAGLYWFVQESLLARLRTSGERYRSVPVLGRTLHLDITDRTGRPPYFYGEPYEPAVTDAIAAALGPGDVFVDIGANIGYFSVLAATIVGDRGRVIAFEPYDRARRTLEEMVLRNGATPTVEIVPLALADAAGTAPLFVEEGVSAHSTIEPDLSPMRHVADLRRASNVSVTTLDAWMQTRPDLPARVRCIKIDVEGAEARVLAGMPETLGAPGVAIVCETTLGSPADRTLEAAGFRCRRIEPGDSSYGNFLYLRP